MRSLRDLVAPLILTMLASCGTELGEPVDPPCNMLSYENFGEPFVLDWCRGCHSSALPEDMRQGAPVGVDFDTLDRVRAWRTKMTARISGAAPTMPPAAGPSQEEREMMVEWLQCGAL